MSNPVVISVENLGKTYRISHQTKRQPYLTLREVFAERFEGLFRPRRRQRNRFSSTEDFWALRNVSFKVRQGEVIGIIGRNGVGKSTLLKIVSRIAEPSEGRVRIKGRVASLLEVGTGFHPELTGRENIYLNGAILGMSRAEIKRKFDEIVAFAGVETFLDTPVKRYSSGMYVRLAFAVAAHLEPEILLVDEVLAVGDAAFQEKCLGKMKKVVEGGRTVLFVSHNMSTIQELCNTCILIRHGRIYNAGKPAEVVGDYLSDSKTTSDVEIRNWQDRTGSGEARLVRLTITDVTNSPTSVFPFGGVMRFILEAEVYESLTDPHFGVVIHASSGEPILDLHSAHNGLRVGKVHGIVRIQGTLPNIGLYPGRYFLSPSITDAAVQRNIDFLRMCCSIEIIPKPGEFGALRLDPRWGKYWVSSVWKAIGAGADGSGSRCDSVTSGVR